MADVTISQLTPGVPPSSALFPYSDGSTTKSSTLTDLNIIKQIQYNYYDGVFNTSSTAIQEVANFNVSITPSSSTSKIIIYVSSWGGSSSGGGNLGTYTGLNGFIYRYTVANGNVLLPLTSVTGQTNTKCHLVFTGASQYDMGAATIMMVDQPNTTSQVTYKIFAGAQQSGYTGTINRSLNGALGPLARSWIYAVEF